MTTAKTWIETVVNTTDRSDYQYILFLVFNPFSHPALDTTTIIADLLDQVVPLPWEFTTLMNPRFWTTVHK